MVICKHCNQPMRRDVGGIKGTEVTFDTFTCECFGIGKACLPDGSDLLEFWTAHRGEVPPGSTLTPGHVESVRVMNEHKPGTAITVARVGADGIVQNVEMCDPDWFARRGDGYVVTTMANPAVVGGTYVDGFFYGVQPYPSWTMKEGRWEPPVAKPRLQAGTRHEWDEQAQTWRETKEA